MPSLPLSVSAFALGTLFPNPSAHASTPHDKAPWVQAQQKSENPSNAAQEAQPSQSVAPNHTAIVSPPQTSREHGNAEPQTGEGEQEGTEFWRPFFGCKFKITDSRR